MNKRKYKNSMNRMLPIAALLVLLVAIPFVLYTLFHASSARAEWFNTSWGYRQAVRFTNGGAAVTDQKVLIAIDTSTLITATKMQSSCQDVRFTDAGGKLLQYFINVSGGAGVGCNDASSDFYILMPSIVVGENLIYMYYGNPSALAGTSSANFGNTTFSPSAGPTASTEEIGAVPFLSYNFDSGYGTTVSDASGNGNHGTITNASWRTSESCVSNACLQFNGSTTYVKRAVSNFNSTASYGSIEAWVRVSSYGTGGYIFASGDDGSANRLLGVGIDSSGRLIVYQQNNDTSDIIVSGNTVTLNQWTHVAVVSSGSGYTFYINGESQSLTVSGGTNSGDWFADTTLRDNITVGVLGWNSTNNYYINGTVDELKIYNTARTRAQVLADMNARTSSADASTVIGGANTASLSNGLVGYWKMDENTGTSVSDISGNGNTGTLTNSPVWDQGRFGSGIKFDSATTNKYITVPAATSINNMSKFTLSAWVNPSQLQGTTHILYKSNKYGLFFENISSGLRTQFEMSCSGGFLSVYATSADNLPLNAWSHIAATWDGTGCGLESVTVYINGKPITKHANSDAASGSKDDDSGGPFTIGNKYSGYSSQLQGYIDETRVYDRVLNPTEIRQLYNWAPGPVGWWKMDENTGTGTAYDSSGNGRDGTMTGLALDDWVPGKFGSALDFDNANDKVSIADNDVFSINTTNQFTVEAWFNPSDLTLTQEVVNKGSGSNYEWALRVNGDGTLNAYTYQSGGGDHMTYQYATPLQRNRWYHIAMTANFSAPSLKLYVNGTLVGEDITATGSYTNGTAALRIGERADSLRDVDGIIDDVRIYNYARTPSQIVEDMNGGHPPGGSPMESSIMHWKFDEAQGATANNLGYGGSGYNGTITGATWYPGGKVGSAIATTTSTNFVSAGDQAFVDNLTGMSIGMWVKPITLATNKALVSKSNFSTQNSFAVVTDNSASDEVRVHISTSVSDTSTYFLTSNLNLTADTWSYLNVTYNASESASTRVRVYKDGKEISGSVTGTLPDKMTTGTTSLLKVGASDSGSYTALNAVFDDMKIYPYALTYDQMLIDYNGKAALQFGSLSTHSDGATASNSATREFCVPGDTSSCAPPVGYWKFDENTGTTNNDSSGNGNSLTMTNSPVLARGKIGSGLDFNGISAVSANYSVSPALVIPGDVTLGAWIYRDTTATDMAIVREDGDGAGDAGNENYRLWINTSNIVKLQWSYSASQTVETVSSSVGLTNPSGKWVYLVAVRDTTANTVKFYEDGIQLGTTVSYTNDPSGGSTAPDIYVGARDASNGDPFDGRIDEVKVYNYTRSPAQISWDYNRGAPLAHYKFDECQGSTAYNIAPNADGKAAGKNGTITIGATSIYTSLGTCGSGTSTEAWNGGTTGKYGASLSLDGTDDYASVSSPSLPTGDFSYAAWFKVDDLSNDRTIFMTSDGSAASEMILRIVADVNPTNPNKIEFGADDTTAFTTQTVQTGRWYHVAFTRTSGTMRVYLNGKLDATTGSDSTTLNFSTCQFFIGLDVDTSGCAGVLSDYFDGLIDDVRIYNYALTQHQVNVVMNENGAVRFGP